MLSTIGDFHVDSLVILAFRGNFRSMDRFTVNNLSSLCCLRIHLVDKLHNIVPAQGDHFLPVPFLVPFRHSSQSTIEIAFSFLRMLPLLSMSHQIRLNRVYSEALDGRGNSAVLIVCLPPETDMN